MPEPPDWITLTAGEEVVRRDRPSLVPYLASMTGSIALVALAVGAWLVAAGALAPDVALPGNVVDPVALLLVALGGIGIVRRLLTWWSVEYVVTTEEIYSKRGLVSRTVTNLRLERVQNTTFAQSAVGRLFSYGDVRITTAGTDRTEVVFEDVSDPDEVVATITRRLGEA